MKYLEFIGILLFTPFRKVFGLAWYYVVLSYRGYANNAVFNYYLQNDIYLARLNQKTITRSTNGDYLIAPGHGTDGGYIKFRKISWIEYQFAFWIIWGWLDSDSYHDTFSEDYNNRLIYGDAWSLLPKFIVNRLIAATKTPNYKVQGNTFDLGDKRAQYPEFSFWASTFWNIRNTGYNFQYKFNERLDQPFCYTINSKLYGWAKEPWETGYKLVLNFTHKGEV